MVLSMDETKLPAHMQKVSLREKDNKPNKHLEKTANAILNGAKQY